MRTLKPLRRLLAATALAALAVAGAAVADAGGPATATQVTASFYANTLVSSHSSSCTGVNNDAIQIVHERFTGTAASSDPHLAGAVTVDVRSVLDTTKNLGWLAGDLRIATASAGNFHAHFAAVNTGGTATGFLAGDGGGTNLLGEFSGSFSTTAGFGSSTAQVAIGSGSPASTAVLTSGGCASQPPHPDPSQGEHDQHGPKNDDHH